MKWGESCQTENEIMEKHRYYKVWDCGSARYELDF